MKELWNNTWNFFSGKKTIIGLLILWLVDRPWLRDMLPDGTIENSVVDILFVVGSTLAGLGFLHKGVKVVEDHESKREHPHG